MLQTHPQHVQIHLSGQDDNLGDSVLRDGLLRALRGRDRRFHVWVGAQSSDYMTGLSLGETDTLYTNRAEWLNARGPGAKPIHVVNAGEINPQQGGYPTPGRVRELRAVLTAGGAVVAAGLGIKTPSEITSETFAPTFREAQIMSWRDYGSREAAGFGEVNPDWAFSLGTQTSEWPGRSARKLLAVTLRFDRPYPGDAWFDAVRAIARRTDTRIVTLAQVGRDAPRAVRVAAQLGGEFLVPPTFSHAELDAYARSIFRQSVAVISDRAHGLIIGATEGAVPLGSAADPQKIVRLLDTVRLGALVGHYDDLLSYESRIDEQIPLLAPAINESRARLNELTVRIHALLGALEP